MSRRIKKSSIKFLIPLVLLFMFIGFATVSTTLSINGDMELLSDLDDFNIYYSRAVVNGEEDPSIIKSSTELDFGAALKTVGVDYVIEYDITNASSAFDAQVSINCSASTEYFSITNDFDSDTPIGSRQTRTGTMTLRKIKTVAGDEQSNTISCDIVATPVERESEGSGDVPIPVESYFAIGKEISIGDEKFNIISDNGDTVTMLAQLRIGNDYRQTKSDYIADFSFVQGWEYTPGPKEVDLDIFSGSTSNLVGGYESNMKFLTGDNNLSADIITLSQLKQLGCTINDDYSFSSGLTCLSSPFIDWLDNGDSWWTKSANSSYSMDIWFVSGAKLDSLEYYEIAAVRPIITVSKDVLLSLNNYKKYSVGEEVLIGDEKFNVVSDDGGAVTLLSQYNLSSGYRQSNVANNVVFSADGAYMWYNGGEEIELDIYSNSVKSYIDNYVSYLQGIAGTELIQGDLLTASELNKLGCSVNVKYYNFSGGETCNSSAYKGWLINGQNWWTKSGVANFDSQLWTVGSTGNLLRTNFNQALGVRPVVTIPKEVLQNRIILFYVSDVAYRAYEGMTWEEWVNSDFNTDHFSISNGLVVTPSGSLLWGNITSDELISENRDYRRDSADPT